MISDIYIPTMTLLVKYYEEDPFNEFVKSSFPSCIKDHLPESINFISIEYKTDLIIEALLEQQIFNDLDAINELVEKGAEIEAGYFHIQFDADDDLTRTYLPEVEFVLQKLHESYSFISSYHFYLDGEKVRRFCKMHTFESDVEEDDEHPDLNDYRELLEGYFYKGVIPESFSDQVAKMMLLKGVI